MATNDRTIDPRTGARDAPELHARTTVSDDGTTRCTILPKEATTSEQATKWISAEEGSYVDVEQMR